MKSLSAKRGGKVGRTRKEIVEAAKLPRCPRTAMAVQCAPTCTRPSLARMQEPRTRNRRKNSVGVECTTATIGEREAAVYRCVTGGKDLAWGARERCHNGTSTSSRPKPTGSEEYGVNEN